MNRRMFRVRTCNRPNGKYVNLSDLLTWLSALGELEQSADQLAALESIFHKINNLKDDRYKVGGSGTY